MQHVVQCPVAEVRNLLVGHDGHRAGRLASGLLVFARGVDRGIEQGVQGKNVGFRLLRCHAQKKDDSGSCAVDFSAYAER